jgi:16S rRNA (cytosine1402-N4)-methyltransferase
MRADWGHTPVLLEEAVEALRVSDGGVWIDGTFGRGGHTAEILRRLGPSALVLAFDRDPEAEQVAAQRFAGEPRLRFHRGDFTAMEQELSTLGAGRRVQGILLDLGVSSPQLESAERGFSFLRDGPLDMRMDPERGQSAAEWLATVGEAELDRVLQELGEERFHRRLARAIVTVRAERPIVSTRQLAELVAAVVPTREPGQHPATRAFQAIRIRVNQELQQLGLVLEQAVRVLAPAGRLAVITFHSLEDRIVKRFLRQQARGAQLPRGIPLSADQSGATLRLLGGPRRPRAEECARNPRARSALLRVAERLP